LRQLGFLVGKVPDFDQKIIDYNTTEKKRITGFFRKKRVKLTKGKTE